MLVRPAAAVAAVVAAAVAVAVVVAAAAAAEGAGRRADRTCLLRRLSCKASHQQLGAPGEGSFGLWAREGQGLGWWVLLWANLLQRGRRRRHAQGAKCERQKRQLFN